MDNVVDDLLILSHAGRRILPKCMIKGNKTPSTETTAKPPQNSKCNPKRRYHVKLLADKLRAFAGLGKKELTNEVIKRYDYIRQNSGNSMDSELRPIFEYYSLVYVPSLHAWYPSSSCVWAGSNVQIPGKVSIADMYKSSKMFFTNILGVQEPTVEEHVKELISKAEANAPVIELKATMMLICSMNLEGLDVSSLKEAKFLPVKSADGSVQLASASESEESSDFAILDRMEHVNAFTGRIAVLDFSIGEIMDFKPLLSALDLERRFSSKLVKEVTDVAGGTLDVNMTNLYCLKSQAILRYVTTSKA